VDPRGLEKAKDAFDVIYEETLETGAERTLQRFIDSSKGIGDRTMLQNAMRLLGIRDYNWDADVSFKMHFANVNEPMRQAKSNYSSAMRKFENNKISAEELELSIKETMKPVGFSLILCVSTMQIWAVEHGNTTKMSALS
jgi:hypothetical protein